MVLGEIGEHPGGEGQSLHPVLDQGVGGHLHHHMGAPRVRHLPQQLLNLAALRGGAVGGKAKGADLVLDGADKARLGPQHPLQQVLDETGGGGLAVGAGDAHQGELLGRMSKPVGGGQGQGPPGVGCHQPGPFPLRRRLAQHGGRPFFQSLPDKPRPVGLGPGQRHKQGPGLQGPGVVG